MHMWTKWYLIYHCQTNCCLPLLLGGYCKSIMVNVQTGGGYVKYLIRLYSHTELYIIRADELVVVI